MKAKIRFYSDLAYQAMLNEVNLTPKPGLVDCYSNGAHRDMTLAHFHASAKAIAPYLQQFIEAGVTSHTLAADQILGQIRPIGIACERAMLRATDSVNTHKGSIFSLGLAATAIGRLLAQGQPVTPTVIGHSVAQFCRHIVKRELQQVNQRLTAGQRLFIAHGLTGARGEAESGFKTVLTVSLPIYQTFIKQRHGDEKALHQALLHLMAVNNDTNVVARGGLDGLLWLQQQAKRLLQSGGVLHPDYIDFLRRFDQACIAKNLSPGGCADLLILTWFLGQLAQK